MEGHMTLQSHSWAYIQKKTRSKKTQYMHPMFTATLFTTAKTRKQPKCSSTEEWIKKMWYINTKEYYSAIKRNAFESLLLRWMNLEPILQSKVSQKEKDKYHILMHIYALGL